MSILKDFRDELGEDPEPILRRWLSTGVRASELAEAVQEYLRDQQEVGDDGVIVPNVLRVTLGNRDHERLSRFGVALPRALGTVVVETAAEQGWTLVGPVKVRIDRDELVQSGVYRLVGRVEPVAGWGPAVEPEQRTAAASAAAMSGTRTAAGAPDAADAADTGGVNDPTLIVLSGVDAGARLVLDGRRVTAGRGSSCDLVVRDTTVSREHAAFVLRSDTWWVLDLGSTNGTRINGLRAAEHPIVPGDRVELGDVVVELVEA
jgi:pSer/pThr/pTyr-binding forkhead associated (FHA) protein